jgi:DNA helicase-2/ATP-dependent DNA helicase PcrA
MLMRRTETANASTTPYSAAKALLKRRPAPGAKALRGGWIWWLGEVFDLIQWTAITSPPELSTLVLGCCGTGKTMVLVARLVWLVMQHSVDPKTILLLTHMNDAADEMFTRAQKLLGDTYKLDRSTRRNGGTENSWCCWLLRKWGWKIGISDSFDLAETNIMLDDICGELNLHTEVKKRVDEIAHQWSVARLRLGNARSHMKNAIKRSYSSWVEHAKKRKKTIPSLKIMRRQVLRLVDAYEERKTASNVLDFTDQIVKADKLLRRKDMQARLQKMYSHVLLDEFQDNTRRQSKLIERFMADRGGVFAVCCPCQSILRFAGATLTNTTKFADHFGESEIHVLENNYRSVQPILDPLRGLAAQVEEIPFMERYLDGFNSAIDDGRKPWLITASCVEEGDRWTVEKIKRRHDAGVEWRRIAVIARCWDHLVEIEELLKEAGIPVKGSRTRRTKSLECALARFLALLRLGLNPRSVEALNLVLCLAKGVGKGTARKIVDAVAGSTDVRAATKANLKGKKNKTAKGMRRILRRISEIQELAESPLEAITTAWRCYTKLAPDDAQRIEHIFNDMVRSASDHASLRDLMDETDGRRRPADDGEDAVTLAVPHTAKGRQWDYVFIARVCEGGFPLLHATADLMEELFNLFVALSRARRRLYLVYPRSVAFSHYNEQPVELSRFLAPLVDLLDQHDAAVGLRRLERAAKPKTTSGETSTERRERPDWMPEVIPPEWRQPPVDQ